MLRFAKPGVKEDALAEQLLKDWAIPRLLEQRAKIRARLGISSDAPIDPRLERMSLSFDGCGPFLFRILAMIKAGEHVDLCLHLLNLCAGGTGIKGSGQENDRSPVFPHFKSDIHTRDRNYCIMFLKKDPLAETDATILSKACAFWEPFHLGTSISVNYVAKLISGVDPELGFRFKKVKPLLRLIFIHTENRHVTFSRSKIYAGFVDVGNRTIINEDGTKGGDWRRALMMNPGIQKLPVEQGRKFYLPEGRRQQLREVEQQGFVRDAWYCENGYPIGLYVDPVTGARLCRDLWPLQLRSACIMSCASFIQMIQQQEEQKQEEEAQKLARRIRREGQCVV